MGSSIVRDVPRPTAMIDRLHAWMLRRYPARKAPSHPGLHTLVVFEASDALVARAAVQVRQLLKEKGFAVESCGYFADRLEHPEADYSHFNRKALRWNGQPFGPMIQSMEGKSWRMIVALHRGHCPPVQWLVRMLPASLRIGPLAGEAIYDISLDGHRSDPSGFANHLGNILQTMQTQAHVHT